MPLSTPPFFATLTKRFLQSLTSGQYLVSNVCTSLPDGRSEPCFREVIGPLETRGEQWRRIKSAQADGRQCVVLASESEYEEYRRVSPAPSARAAGTASDLLLLLEGYVYADYFGGLIEFIDRWPDEWRSRLFHRFDQLPFADQSSKTAKALFAEIVREAKAESVNLPRQE